MTKISPINNNIYSSLIHKINKDIMISSITTATTYSSVQSADKVASFIPSYGVSQPVNIGNNLNTYA